MSAMSTSPQLSPRGPLSYPMPAYLNFCPGGVTYAGGEPAEGAFYYLSECTSPSIGQPSGDRRSGSQTPFTSRGASRRAPSTATSRLKPQEDATAVSIDSLVYKAKIADDTLRQYAILSGGNSHQTPYFLPSLSVLAEAAFGRLTGVPADSVKAWADAMVIQYLETAPEYSASSTKPPAMKTVTETAANVLKRLLREHENGNGPQVTVSPLSRSRPCGYVFKRGDIAWNCRTCQADSTCVICDSCFRNSNHDGHEVYFHRTTPGGCCDCGDPEAWKNEGCCDAHRPAITSKVESRVDDPEEAIRMAQKSLQESEEGLKNGPTALPPKMAAALGVVIGAAVNCLLQAADGAGIGADPIQWKVRWADEASRLKNRACHNEDYCYQNPVALPNSFLNPVMPEALPNGYVLHLRLHNDDVHTFEEVIDALHEPRHSRRIVQREEEVEAPPLVAIRETATDMTHHVDADGQVTVKKYTTLAAAMQGFRRLKSHGLHCAVVGSSQVDQEQRAKVLSSWLAEISAAHPAVASLVVHALVQLDPRHCLASVFVWQEARMIPPWAALDVLDEAQACQRRFQAFPPHLASSFLTREEAQLLHGLSAKLNANAFLQLTGTSLSFYSKVPYMLQPSRYRKSPHALWGTLPSSYADPNPQSSKHPLLHFLHDGLFDASVQNRLTEGVHVIDTDLRKQQEADRITSSVFPHKLPGLHLISGVGTRPVTKVSPDPPPLPNPMHWRHLLGTSSFRAPASPCLLLLLLDPYPTKQVRSGIHALFLSLLTDARFKCRFAAALGVAYRPLSTLFCAGVGTEADTPLGFTVQIFTAGSLVRALGSPLVAEQLLESDFTGSKDDGEPSIGICTSPLAHSIVRCIHTNVLGATKEVNMILNNTKAGDDNDSQEDADLGNAGLLRALTYVAGEHPLATPLPAAPDDGFLDSRSTRHKRLPHLLRDLEYVIETPGTALRLLLPQRFPVQGLPESSRSGSMQTFASVFARLLRVAQGMDPQKRKISGGHVEYEQNRWLEAFGLSLNFAGTRDALAESLVNSTSSTLTLGMDSKSRLMYTREAMGNMLAALLREVKLWLYREGMLETGLPIPPGGTHGGVDLSQVEALQRSTLHVSGAQGGLPPLSGGPVDPASVSASNINALALSCATGVKMTEAQLNLIESALRVESAQHSQVNVRNCSSLQTSLKCPVLGDWLRVPHSPLAGDSLSFHLPLHRALAKTVRSMCAIVVPESVRNSPGQEWWKLPVLDETTSVSSQDTYSSPYSHPLVSVIRSTLRSSNCRVVWSAGPDCSPQEAQHRRARSRTVSANIAVAKIIHSLADHPIRCLAASQQIERHLWARNGSATAGMALNYSSTPLCQRFRDLDLTLVQLSAAGLSVGLGARKVFELLKSRFSMEGYLCDPERRAQIGSSSPSGGSYGSGSSQWVNPPRMQDQDHAVVLSESFFLILCILVTELPPPPPISERDDTWLRRSIRRELVHALVAEPRSHSEAMAAASCAVSRRDENDGTALSSGGGSLFREAFADVLQEIGKQKNLGSSRVSSGPPAFELKAQICDEYDPTFFHLRRQEHQHAMDVVARLRKSKFGDASGDAFCLPLVCAPPKAHPRFLPCRLLLHLQGMDAALRRALLFALTGGSWLPPSEPEPDTCFEESARGLEQLSEADGSTIPKQNEVSLVAFGGRRVSHVPSASAQFKRSSSEGDKQPPFSPDVVAASSVSFLEVLQLLTLQVHTLEECASLHHAISDLDDEAKLFSAGLSINSYLGRLVHVPESLVDIWAFRPYPHGPLTSSGSGENRGSILGLLIALYEHRADHGAILDSGGGKDYAQGDSGHGGARSLASSGLKWLLRFVNALVDGAHSVGAAVKSATTGVPVHRSSPSANDSETTWTIDQTIRSTICGMLSGLPELWPAEREQGASESKTNDKGKEARKAAQARVLALMREKQAAFAASIVPSGHGALMDDTEGEEADLCIICRCDDTYGENNGPLGYLGHVQRSRVAQMRSMKEAVTRGHNRSVGGSLLQMYRVVGHMGCQLRETEAMDSRPLSCLQRGSIVTVMKVTMLDKYDILSRRVLVRHVSVRPHDHGFVTEGWASVQSSQGYVILSPLATVCYSNSRWGSTRPIIRQCGHAAHLKCVEAHSLSLHQRAAGEQPYDGRFAANIDDGEFLCPLCKQLSNILIPRDSFVGVSSSEKQSEVMMQEANDGAPNKDTMTRSDEPRVSLREKIAMGGWPSASKAKRLSVMGRDALKDFGAHLFQAMDVPWERQVGWRSQAQLHPAILRWDYEEEDEVGNVDRINGESPKETPRGKSILRLLRQQHIAWAALGHSAAALEASTRGLEEVLPFGVTSSTADPWPDFNSDDKDRHPMLLELKRTVAGVSGLYEVLTDEISTELGFAKSDSKTPSVGVLLADILDGNSWFHSRSENSTEEEKERLVLWSQLTSLMTSIPCHVARDGQLSKRSEARASAAAMWTIKGLGSQRKKMSDPPVPLAISKVSESLKKTHCTEIISGWGTLDPRGCGLEAQQPKVPFRPAVACAFLYTPLLAWDLNTMAGALFSSILAIDIQDLPTSKELLHLAHSLLVARLIQAIITPGGIVPSICEDDEDGMVWSLSEIKKEGSALVQLSQKCRNRLKEVTRTGSEFLDDIAGSEALPMFSAVGEALLPLSRSIILLLRTVNAIIRERQGLSQGTPSQNELDRRLENVMTDTDLMASEDGFVIYKAFDGPLPSLIMQPTSHWWVIVEKWLVAASAWEAHHGCDGRSIIPFTGTQADTSSIYHVSAAEDSKDTTMTGVDGANLSVQCDDVAEDITSPAVDKSGSFEDHDDMNDSDEEIVEGMEVDNDIPVVELPDTIDGHDAQSSVRQGQAGSQFRSEDSSEDNSHTSFKDELDREFAGVSTSPIISYQPSIFGLVGIGAIRQGTFFESESAKKVMSDLSHLGMIHSKEVPTFSLVRLPSSFVELYSIVNKVKGRDEGSMVDESDDVSTSETAICLVTGTVLRSGSTRRAFSTRAARPPGACTLHARKTGSGIGVFFLVQKCTVLLMHNNKSAYSASLYVDEHGEEDPGLRRGRPLFLNQARYRALEVLWRQQGIPREVAQIRSTSDRVIRDNWY